MIIVQLVFVFFLGLALGSNVMATEPDRQHCLKLGILPLVPEVETVKKAGQSLFASVGGCVEFVAAPVRRAESMTISGTLDGEFLRTRTWAEGLGNSVIVVPTPLHEAQVLAISLARRELNIKSLDDLRGKRVIIVGGHRWAETKLEELNMMPVVVNNADRYVELLRLERADVGLSEQLGMEHFLNKPEFISMPVAKITYHIVLRQEHSDIVPNLDQAIKTFLSGRMH